MSGVQAARGASGESIEQLARTWFTLLSEHAPVEQLLRRVSEGELEMVFPERTLRSHADFKDWYEQVGELFREQVHVIERLDWREQGVGVAVEVTVIWEATQVADGRRRAFRATQSWLLERTGQGGPLVITRYRVRALEELR